MVIGSAVFTLSIEQAHSLKEKRHVVQSLKQRLNNKFNIAVSEVADQDIWNRCVLAVVTVSTDRVHVDEVLSNVASFVESFGEAVLLEIEQEIF